MGISYSKSDLINLLSGQAKYDAINKLNRPNKDSTNDILNFKHYYNGLTIETGKNGPELNNDKVYISIYHFMEYNGINPNNFDTFEIGNRLERRTNDYTICKYEEHDYKINKYEYSFIETNQNIFNDFRK
jgi:hypothetical protein